MAHITKYINQFISGCSLDELLLFALTNVVRPKTEKTEILHLTIDRMELFRTQIYKILNQAPHQLLWAGFYIARTKHKKFFHEFEFVNKFNLKTQNPTRNNGIMGISAGLKITLYLSYNLLI